MTNYQPTRVGFILPAVDVLALAGFYESALGFERAQTFEDPPYVILTLMGMRLSLTVDGSTSDDLPDFVFRTDPDRSQSASCMVIEVSDCDAARAHLTERGVTMRSETFRPPWGGARFFCEDPEGNLIEIEELA